MNIAVDTDLIKQNQKTHFVQKVPGPPRKVRRVPGSVSRLVSSSLGVQNEVKLGSINKKKIGSKPQNIDSNSRRVQF